MYCRFIVDVCGICFLVPHLGNYIVILENPVYNLESFLKIFWIIDDGLCLTLKTSNYPLAEKLWFKLKFQFNLVCCFSICTNTKITLGEFVILYSIMNCADDQIKFMIQ